MAAKWNEVEASPEYQGLNESDRYKLKQRYWENVVSASPDFRGMKRTDQILLQNRFFGSQAKGPPPAMKQAFDKAGLVPQMFRPETGPPTPDVLGAVAEGGAKLQKGIENLVQPLANKGGLPGTLAATAIGTASRFILPTDRKEAAVQLMSLPLMGLGKSAGAASKELGPLLEDAGKFVKPSPVDRLVGQAVSATSAVPERYATAVAADSSILSDKTKTVAEMGKAYQQAFKDAGMKINSQELERITGNPFPANDNELDKLQKIVVDARNKLQVNKLGPNEAFFARSAAARIERSNAAMKNPGIRQVASGFKSMFDDLLVNSDLPNIKALSRDYFRAIAKEYFQPFFPKNKNMSPNAVRSLLLLRQGTKALGSLAAGDIPGAAMSAVEGAAMSPKLTGKMLQGYGAIKNAAVAPVNPAIKAMIPPSLARLMRKKKKETLDSINQDAGPNP